MGVRPLVLCRLRVWDRPNLNRVPYNTRDDRHQRIGWVDGNQRPVDSCARVAGRLRSSRNGRMSVEIAGPITLRSPRSSKVISSMNPQRAPTIRALHSSIRARLRRPKTVGKHLQKNPTPAFDVRRIGCLAPARMSPVRSRCCHRAFFTQHVTVRTRRCRPPSVAVRSGARASLFNLAGCR